MNVRYYLNLIERRKWLILITTLAAIAGAVLVMRMMPPVYAATALIRITQTQTDNADYWHFQSGELLKNTYTRLLTSTPILQEVIASLDLDLSPLELQQQVAVQRIAESELLQITVENEDRQQSIAIADGLADALIRVNSEAGVLQGSALRQIVDARLAELDKELENDTQALQAATDALVRLRALEAREEPETFTEQPLLEQQQSNITQLTNLIQEKERTYGVLLNQRAIALAAELVPPYTVSIVQPADWPAVPVRPRVVLGLVLAGFLGLFGGVCLALLLENVDTTLHTSEQIGAVTKMHTLAEVPQVRAKSVSAWMDGASPQGEAFRRLRTNILFVKPTAAAAQGQSLLITSAQPREGKSTIAANLARTLAATGQRVILVDADMRRPVQHSVFGLPNGAGLSSVLQEAMCWQVVVNRSSIARLDVLTSGPLPQAPCELLASSKMATLVSKLQANYDTVLLDTPAALDVADATVLAPLVDGVVLVVGRDLVRQEAVQAVCEQLTAVHAHPVGVVVNRARPRHAHYYARDS